MTAPAAEDVSHDGRAAAVEYTQHRETGAQWCGASLDEVRTNLLATGYPADRIHYAQGRVEETIPATLPGNLALLRLDTDWYESTRHEMRHLFPLLHVDGILIVDDYGHWRGARKAVDEYFGNHPPFLHRIDYTGRLVASAGRWFKENAGRSS